MNGRPAPFGGWTEPGLQTVWIFSFCSDPNDFRFGDKIDLPQAARIKHEQTTNKTGEIR
jgi:hypothetical protein